MNFLYAAYGATWIIHIAYIWLLSRRYHKLKQEIEEESRK
jgi:CcmD family protein